MNRPPAATGANGAGSGASWPTPIRRSKRRRCNGYNRLSISLLNRLFHPLRQGPYGLSRGRTSHRAPRRTPAAGPAGCLWRQSAPGSKPWCRRRCRRRRRQRRVRKPPTPDGQTLPKIRHSRADAGGNGCARDRSRAAQPTGDRPPPPRRAPTRWRRRQRGTARNRSRNRRPKDNWFEVA